MNICELQISYEKIAFSAGYTVRMAVTRYWRETQRPCQKFLAHARIRKTFFSIRYRNALESLERMLYGTRCYLESLFYNVMGNLCRGFFHALVYKGFFQKNIFIGILVRTAPSEILSKRVHVTTSLNSDQLYVWNHIWRADNSWNFLVELLVIPYMPCIFRVNCVCYIVPSPNI